MSKFSLPLLASILIVIASFVILLPRRTQPQSGCYYQQVQCVRAPCNPILVCPSPTCTPRPKCLDANPRCLMPETSDMCPPETFIYECPPSGWVDCMPGPGPAKPQCQPDYLAWIQSNCPDFEGVAY